MSFIERRPLQRVMRAFLPFLERRDEDRVAELYLEDLGLTWPYLRCKKILDIGGKAEFAKSAKRRDITVVSLDIVADFKEGTGLPGQSFDLLVARTPLLAMDWNKIELERVLNEAKRLLKPAGEFRFTPHPNAPFVRAGLHGKTRSEIPKFTAPLPLRSEASPLRGARPGVVGAGFTTPISRLPGHFDLAEKEQKNPDEMALKLLQELDPSIEMYTTHSKFGTHTYFVMRKFQV